MKQKFKKILDSIAKDRTSGAAKLTQQALLLLKEFAKETNTNAFQTECQQLSQALENSQPDMAPMISLARKAARAKTPDHLLQCVHYFQEILSKAKHNIANKIEKMIKDHDKVITHSFSSTVKAAILTLHRRGKTFEVVVTESLPGAEGKALFAQLSKEGIFCTLIKDDDMAASIKACAFVIVGADWIGRDFFVNKVGTYKLAKYAQKLNTPFFILSDTTKYVSGPYYGKSKIFETIPLTLVTGIITEKGVLGYEEKSTR